MKPIVWVLIGDGIPEGLEEALSHLLSPTCNLQFRSTVH